MQSTTKVKPKKELGQHFLTDLSVARRIASTVDDCHDMPILEVGPGMGVLTQFLLAEGHDVTVVELDSESVTYLNSNMPALKDRIVEADFLTLDLDSVMAHRKFAVIGNYPYNISSQIFFKILDYKDQIPVCSGMLQREVAERLAAPAGTKARGILSVLLQAWYDVRYLFTVSEGVFNPPPKVKSGVVKLTRNSRTKLPCDEHLFRTVVKTAFGQRRKTLRNSVKSLLASVDPVLMAMPIMAKRPEQLSVDEFFELTDLIAANRSNTTNEQ